MKHLFHILAHAVKHGSYWCTRCKDRTSHANGKCLRCGMED